MFSIRIVMKKATYIHNIYFSAINTKAQVSESLLLKCQAMPTDQPDDLTTLYRPVGV